MDLPTEIITKGLGQHGGSFGTGHYDVMLEPGPTHVAHQLLEPRDVGDGAGAEGIERVVGQLAFGHVSADAAFRIGGGHAATS